MNEKNRPPEESGPLPLPAADRPVAGPPVFTVAVAGLGARELRLIDIAFRHQKGELRLFERVDLRPLFGDGPYPDIVLANPFAVEGVKALARARTVNDQLPTIHVVTLSSPARARYTIYLERISLQLMNRLNEVVETAFESARPGAGLLHVSPEPGVATGKGGPDAATVPPFPLSLQLPDSLDLPDLSDLPLPEDSADSLPLARVPAAAALPCEPAPAAPVMPAQAEANGDADDADPSKRHSSDAKDVGRAEDGDAGAVSPGSDKVASLPSVASAEVEPVGAESVELASVEAEAGPEPASEPVEAAPVVLQSKSSPVPTVKRKRRLTQALIVGSTPSAADAIELGFAQLGSTSLHCARAENRRQVIEHLDYQACQLVMIEKNLPEGSGFRLARELHRRFPEVVVVMLADRFSWLDVLRGRLAGCASLLARPFAPARLRAAVRRPLRRARDRQTLWAVAQGGEQSVWGQTAWLDTGIGR